MLRRNSADPPFDGEGSYRFGGRWPSSGVRLSYTSEHQSLAMLEYFIHLDKDDPPADLVLAIAEIPDLVSRTQIAAGGLTGNWRDPRAAPEFGHFGNDVVQGG